MPIKKSLIQTWVFSKWTAFLFVILAGFLIFSWGQRSFAARQAPVQANTGGSPFSSSMRARQSSGTNQRQTTATRDNFDSRVGH
ncbi:MAG: hypothetical protein L0220_29120 [Acidobacteria bacterium]|nr:hypothetical protein [Acidobacteriota bacterium]